MISLINLGGIQCGDKIPSSFFSLRLKHLAKTFFYYSRHGRMDINRHSSNNEANHFYSFSMLFIDLATGEDKQYPIDDMTNVFIFSSQTRTNSLFRTVTFFNIIV